MEKSTFKTTKSGDVQQKTTTKNESVLDFYQKHAPKKYLNLTTMEKNHFYRITSAKITTSKFGDRLTVELDDKYQLYLPQRFVKMAPSDVVELGSGKYKLINRGKKGFRYKLELAEPEDTSDDESLSDNDDTINVNQKSNYFNGDIEAYFDSM